MSGSTREDLQGLTGNAYDKYGTRNPVSRFLVGRFLGALDGVVRAADPASVLDVGCGEGIVTERIARLLPGRPVTGVDVEDPALQAAWAARGGPKELAFRTGSAYRLPFEDGAFDVVCAIEVLEHLERPAEAVAELARVARRALVASTPREPLWRAANMANGRYLRDLGNTPGHINHWSRRGLVRLLSAAGPVEEVRSPLPWTIARVRLHGLDGRRPAGA